MEQKPLSSKEKSKLEVKIETLNIISVILFLVQVLAYILVKDDSNYSQTTNKPLAYYIGFNLWIIIAIVLYVRASSLKKKLGDNKEIEDQNQ